jgi:predicted nucleic acid-binding protein
LIVVSNSSPLIALSIVNSLDLLHALYGTIYIPEAVFHEVVIRGAGRPGATAVANTAWIVQQAPAYWNARRSLSPPRTKACLQQSNRCSVS